MGLEATEATALASTLFAAVAAGASWANVIQTRRSLRASVLPELHVTGQRVEPSGPVFGGLGKTTSVQFDVYNAGGGIAKGVVYVLYYGLGEYVIGFVAPMDQASPDVPTDHRPHANGARCVLGRDRCMP